ncbi:hypothetical protein J5N97_001186 [Dioscorea zingiberensis]|uniref:Uncharacterized protein n=1 Tax=Dioscorea zingiberensis TaxID=325984 RepID=A0A9D5H2F6_9LILI|nr:hypothetical protein J5N97_001186 [Dioscorea zingiberensis]
MSSFSCSYILSLHFISIVFVLPARAQQSTGACFTSIISFGDSIADTGNLIFALNNSHRVNRLPYGETFFHHPTGRFSDGRLIADFIANALGLPLLTPYLPYYGDGWSFRKGVNFAVAGSTALNDDFFNEKGIKLETKNISLDVQLKWFKDFLSFMCSSKEECEDKLSSSLFLMREIGGNDFNYPFFQGRSFEEVRTFVPSVINAISLAITVVIELGARTLLVPGNFPIGCIPAYLSTFHVSNAKDYDEETGCIKWLNDFSEYYNQLLIKELDHLRKMHPHTTIIYADYYQALITIYQSPEKYGFQSSPLVACCGVGGLYNYNSSCMCGDLGSTVCMEPSRHLSWDGLHFTEVKLCENCSCGLLQGKYTNPPFTETCALLEPIGNLEFPRNTF